VVISLTIFIWGENHPFTYQDWKEFWKYDRGVENIIGGEKFQIRGRGGGGHLLSLNENTVNTQIMNDCETQHFLTFLSSKEGTSDDEFG